MDAFKSKMKDTKAGVQDEVANWTGDAAHDIDDYCHKQGHSNDGVGVPQRMYIEPCCRQRGELMSSIR